MGANPDTQLRQLRTKLKPKHVYYCRPHKLIELALKGAETDANRPG